MRWTHKSRAFWPLLVALVLADCSTKYMAVERLSPAHIPHEVWGDAVRFTLAYNPGAALGVSLGPYSREVLAVAATVALMVLGAMYRRTSPSDRGRAIGLALVAGGAVGNLLDRLLSPRGVVDFIDVGIGATRFWTFNLADVGILLGAAILARELRRMNTAVAAAEVRIPQRQ